MAQSNSQNGTSLSNLTHLVQQTRTDWDPLLDALGGIGHVHIETTEDPQELEIFNQ
jgi:hypothetical protein